MAFNPALPAANSPIASAELRSQLTGLKDLIDARPDTAAVQNLIATDSAGYPGAVNSLSLTISDPPTQAQVQIIVNKINELLLALQRAY